jgi:sugar phosphate isomerase/epimerase
LIQAIGRPNVGVNFDAANFILYGSDDPLAALETLAPFVRGVHCKDGRRPERIGQLGVEVPIGQGEVDFPQFLAALGQHGYTGPLIIEREHGPNVVGDVLGARDYLSALLQ